MAKTKRPTDQDAADAKRIALDIQRLRDAVELVLRDAGRALGPDALSVLFESDEIPEELGYLTDPVIRGLPWDVFSTCDAFIYVRGETACVGLAHVPALTDAELLVHAADAIQEVAIESDTYLGRGFPPCPEHPDRMPLTAKVIDGRAMWACPEGAGFCAPIGEWSPPKQ